MRSLFAVATVLLACSLNGAAGVSFASLRATIRPDAPNRSPTRCEAKCNDALSPVCGTNGKTYTNFCVYGVAACKNKTLAIAYTAACVDEPKEDDTDVTASPTETKAPSTGNPDKIDKQLSGSDEVFVVEAPSVRSVDNNDSCTMFCTRQYDPMCGSDGVTYGNLCTFDEANCRAHGRLTVVSQSECPMKSPSV